MTSRNRSVFIIGGLVAAGLASLLIVMSLAGGGATEVTGVPQDRTALGPPDAPVVIEEYSDFQCPYCQRFAQQTEPRIVEEYVKTGKVRFVYRHFAFIGEESVWAAQAAECAANQGRFWTYHDKVFANQAGENRGAFSRDRLKGFARSLELDQAKFNRCLDNNETLDRVQRDKAEAQRLQIRSTPSFFVNGLPIVGALPFEEFKAVIDRQLAKPR